MGSGDADREGTVMGFFSDPCWAGLSSVCGLAGADTNGVVSLEESSRAFSKVSNTALCMVSQCFRSSMNWMRRFLTQS